MRQFTWMLFTNEDHPELIERSGHINNKSKPILAPDQQEAIVEFADLLADRGLRAARIQYVDRPSSFDGANFRAWTLPADAPVARYARRPAVRGVVAP